MRRRVVLIIFLIISIFFSLSLCSCSGMNRNRASQDLSLLRSNFQFGNAVLNCEHFCSATWNWNRKDIKELHDTQQWETLADKVLEIGYHSNLAWYYLGRAAEGIGYSESAWIYYMKGLSDRDCGNVSNCDGFIFPLDINTQLIKLSASTGKTLPNSVKKKPPVFRQPPTTPPEVGHSEPTIPEETIRELVSTGSGFFVSRYGHILTNEHVINNCQEIRVRQPGQQPRIAHIIAKDQSNDLALLKINSGNNNVAMFHVRDAIRAGEGIVVYGFPLAGQLSSNGNVSVGYITALSGLRDDARKIQISAPMQLGNSGGPVLDMTGNVIGVVSSKLDVLEVAKLTDDIAQNVNFAIRISLVKSFLEANSIEYKVSKLEQRLDTADIGEKARSFTVQIGCFD